MMMIKIIIVINRIKFFFRDFFFKKYLVKDIIFYLLYSFIKFFVIFYYSKHKLTLFKIIKYIFILYVLFHIFFVLLLFYIVYFIFFRYFFDIKFILYKIFIKIKDYRLVIYLYKQLYWMYIDLDDFFALIKLNYYLLNIILNQIYLNFASSAFLFNVLFFILSNSKFIFIFFYNYYYSKRTYYRDIILGKLIVLIAHIKYKSRIITCIFFLIGIFLNIPIKRIKKKLKFYFTEGKGVFFLAYMYIICWDILEFLFKYFLIILLFLIKFIIRVPLYICFIILGKTEFSVIRPKKDLAIFFEKLKRKIYTVVSTYINNNSNFLLKKNKYTPLFEFKRDVENLLKFFECVHNEKNEKYIDYNVRFFIIAFTIIFHKKYFFNIGFSDLLDKNYLMELYKDYYFNYLSIFIKRGRKKDNFRKYFTFFYKNLFASNIHYKYKKFINSKIYVCFIYLIIIYKNKFFFDFIVIKSLLFYFFKYNNNIIIKKIIFFFNIINKCKSYFYKNDTDSAFRKEIKRIKKKKMIYEKIINFFISFIYVVISIFFFYSIACVFLIFFYFIVYLFFGVNFFLPNFLLNLSNVLIFLYSIFDFLFSNFFILLNYLDNVVEYYYYFEYFFPETHEYFFNIPFNTEFLSIFYYYNILYYLNLIFELLFHYFSYILVIFFVITDCLNKFFSDICILNSPLLYFHDNLHSYKHLFIGLIEKENFLYETKIFYGLNSNNLFWSFNINDQNKLLEFFFNDLYYQFIFKSYINIRVNAEFFLLNDLSTYGNIFFILLPNKIKNILNLNFLEFKEDFLFFYGDNFYIYDLIVNFDLIVFKNFVKFTFNYIKFLIISLYYYNYLIFIFLNIPLNSNVILNIFFFFGFLLNFLNNLLYFLLNFFNLISNIVYAIFHFEVSFNILYFYLKEFIYLKLLTFSYLDTINFLFENFLLFFNHLIYFYNFYVFILFDFFDLIYTIFIYIPLLLYIIFEHAVKNFIIDFLEIIVMLILLGVAWGIEYTYVYFLVIEHLAIIDFYYYFKEWIFFIYIALFNFIYIYPFFFFIKCIFKIFFLFYSGIKNLFFYILTFIVYLFLRIIKFLSLIFLHIFSNVFFFLYMDIDLKFLNLNFLEINNFVYLIVLNICHILIYFVSKFLDLIAFMFFDLDFGALKLFELFCTIYIYVFCTIDFFIRPLFIDINLYSSMLYYYVVLHYTWFCKFIWGKFENYMNLSKEIELSDNELSNEAIWQKYKHKIVGKRTKALKLTFTEYCFFFPIELTIFLSENPDFILSKRFQEGFFSQEEIMTDLNPFFSWEENKNLNYFQLKLRYFLGKFFLNFSRFKNKFKINLKKFIFKNVFYIKGIYSHRFFFGSYLNNYYEDENMVEDYTIIKKTIKKVFKKTKKRIIRDYFLRKKKIFKILFLSITYYSNLYLKFRFEWIFYGRTLFNQRIFKVFKSFRDSNVKLFWDNSHKYSNFYKSNDFISYTTALEHSKNFKIDFKNYSFSQNNKLIRSIYKNNLDNKNFLITQDIFLEEDKLKFMDFDYSYITDYNVFYTYKDTSIFYNVIYDLFQFPIIPNLNGLLVLFSDEFFLAFSSNSFLSTNINKNYDKNYFKFKDIFYYNYESQHIAPDTYRYAWYVPAWVFIGDTWFFKENFIKNNTRPDNEIFQWYKTFSKFINSYNNPLSEEEFHGSLRRSSEFTRFLLDGELKRELDFFNKKSKLLFWDVSDYADEEDPLFFEEFLFKELEFSYFLPTNDFYNYSYEFFSSLADPTMVNLFFKFKLHETIFFNFWVIIFKLFEKIEDILGKALIISKVSLFSRRYFNPVDESYCNMLKFTISDFLNESFYNLQNLDFYSNSSISEFLRNSNFKKKSYNINGIDLSYYLFEFEDSYLYNENNVKKLDFLTLNQNKLLFIINYFNDSFNFNNNNYIYNDFIFKKKKFTKISDSIDFIELVKLNVNYIFIRNINDFLNIRNNNSRVWFIFCEQYFKYKYYFKYFNIIRIKEKNNCIIDSGMGEYYDYIKYDMGGLKRKWVSEFLKDNSFLNDHLKMNFKEFFLNFNFKEFFLNFNFQEKMKFEFVLNDFSFSYKKDLDILKKNLIFDTKYNYIKVNSDILVTSTKFNNIFKKIVIPFNYPFIYHKRSILFDLNLISFFDSREDGLLMLILGSNLVNYFKENYGFFFELLPEAFYLNFGYYKYIYLYELNDLFNYYNVNKIIEIRLITSENIKSLFKHISNEFELKKNEFLKLFSERLIFELSVLENENLSLYSNLFLTKYIYLNRCIFKFINEYEYEVYSKGLIKNKENFIYYLGFLRNFKNFLRNFNMKVKNFIGNDEFVFYLNYFKNIEIEHTCDDFTFLNNHLNGRIISNEIEYHLSKIKKTIFLPECDDNEKFFSKKILKLSQGRAFNLNDFIAKIPLKLDDEYVLFYKYFYNVDSLIDFFKKNIYNKSYLFFNSKISFKLNNLVVLNFEKFVNIFLERLNFEIRNWKYFKKFKYFSEFYDYYNNSYINYYNDIYIKLKNSNNNYIILNKNKKIFNNSESTVIFKKQIEGILELCDFNFFLDNFYYKKKFLYKYSFFDKDLLLINIFYNFYKLNSFNFLSVNNDKNNNIFNIKINVNLNKLNLKINNVFDYENLPLFLFNKMEDLNVIRNKNNNIIFDNKCFDFNENSNVLNNKNIFNNVLSFLYKHNKNYINYLNFDEILPFFSDENYKYPFYFLSNSIFPENTNIGIYVYKLISFKYMNDIILNNLLNEKIFFFKRPFIDFFSNFFIFKLPRLDHNIKYFNRILFELNNWKLGPYKNDLNMLCEDIDLFLKVGEKIKKIVSNSQEFDTIFLNNNSIRLNVLYDKKYKFGLMLFNKKILFEFQNILNKINCKSILFNNVKNNRLDLLKYYKDNYDLWKNYKNYVDYSLETNSCIAKINNYSFFKKKIDNLNFPLLLYGYKENYFLQNKQVFFDNSYIIDNDSLFSLGNESLFNYYKFYIITNPVFDCDGDMPLLYKRINISKILDLIEINLNNKNIFFFDSYTLNPLNLYSMCLKDLTDLNVIFNRVVFEVENWELGPFRNNVNKLFEFGSEYLFTGINIIKNIKKKIILQDNNIENTLALWYFKKSLDLYNFNDYILSEFNQNLKNLSSILAYVHDKYNIQLNNYPYCLDINYEKDLILNFRLLKLDYFLNLVNLNLNYDASWFFFNYYYVFLKRNQNIVSWDPMDIGQIFYTMDEVFNLVKFKPIGLNFENKIALNLNIFLKNSNLLGNSVDYVWLELDEYSFLSILVDFKNLAEGSEIKKDLENFVFFWPKFLFNYFKRSFILLSDYEINCDVNDRDVMIRNNTILGRYDCVFDRIIDEIKQRKLINYENDDNADFNSLDYIKNKKDFLDMFFEGYIKFYCIQYNFLLNELKSDNIFLLRDLYDKTDNILMKSNIKGLVSFYQKFFFKFLKLRFNLSEKIVFLPNFWYFFDTKFLGYDLNLYGNLIKNEGINLDPKKFILENKFSLKKIPLTTLFGHLNSVFIKNSDVFFLENIGIEYNDKAKLEFFDSDNNDHIDLNFYRNIKSNRLLLDIKDNFTVFLPDVLYINPYKESEFMNKYTGINIYLQNLNLFKDKFKFQNNDITYNFIEYIFPDGFPLSNLDFNLLFLNNINSNKFIHLYIKELIPFWNNQIFNYKQSFFYQNIYLNNFINNFGILYNFIKTNKEFFFNSVQKMLADNCAIKEVLSVPLICLEFSSFLLKMEEYYLDNYSVINFLDDSNISTSSFDSLIDNMELVFRSIRYLNKNNLENFNYSLRNSIFSQYDLKTYFVLFNQNSKFTLFCKNFNDYNLLVNYMDNLFKYGHESSFKVNLSYFEKILLDEAGIDYDSSTGLDGKNLYRQRILFYVTRLGCYINLYAFNDDDENCKRLKNILDTYFFKNTLKYKDFFVPFSYTMFPHFLKDLSEESFNKLSYHITLFNRNSINNLAFLNSKFIDSLKLSNNDENVNFYEKIIGVLNRIKTDTFIMKYISQEMNKSISSGNDFDVKLPLIIYSYINFYNTMGDSYNFYRRDFFNNLKNSLIDLKNGSELDVNEKKIFDINTYKDNFLDFELRLFFLRIQIGNYCFFLNLDVEEVYLNNDIEFYYLNRDPVLKNTILEAEEFSDDFLNKFSNNKNKFEFFNNEFELKKI